MGAATWARRHGRGGVGAAKWARSPPRPGAGVGQVEPRHQRVGERLLLCTLWTAVTVRSYGFGKVSQPEEMARWLGEHARPGERVFTAQWADSSPLFYAAPRLQSLVALDPTLFYVKDPRLFQVYVDVVQGRRPDAARVIRERFGARWVTLWKNPVYERLAEQLVATPGVTLAYRDPYYVVADLGAAR
jgi:hypothetical protein